MAKATSGRPATNSSIPALQKDVVQAKQELASYESKAAQNATMTLITGISGTVYPTYSSQIKSLTQRIANDTKQLNALIPNPNPEGILGESPTDMKYNLPPHQWSLPVDNNSLYGGKITPTSVTNPLVASSATDSKGSYHGLRRSIMWFYGDSGVLSNSGLVAPSGESITTSATVGSSTTATSIPQYSSTSADNYWGFQFLWNPSTISTATTRSSNVVPSVTDKFAGLSGIFTAMETLQFTIVIDRVNDFASLRGVNATNPADLQTNVGQYYLNGFPTNATQDTASQLDELLRKGTMHDIEYLYRMINGSGQTQNGSQLSWTNALGRTTADIGFLFPTAVGFMLSPGNPDSLSYIGWVESLQVNHSVFTQDMIPIHSEVTVQFNAFSRVALTSKKATS